MLFAVARCPLSKDRQTDWLWCRSMLGNVDANAGCREIYKSAHWLDTSEGGQKPRGLGDKAIARKVGIDLRTQSTSRGAGHGTYVEVSDG